MCWFYMICNFIFLFFSSQPICDNFFNISQMFTILRFLGQKTARKLRKNFLFFGKRVISEFQLIFFCHNSYNDYLSHMKLLDAYTFQTISKHFKVFHPILGKLLNFVKFTFFFFLRNKNYNYTH